MALPEQVRKQVEAAEDFYKQQNNDDADGGTPPEQSGVDPQLGSDVGADGQPPASNAGHEQTGGDDPNSETYQQRWRSLQGMYTSEVGRYRGQVQEQGTRIAQLENLLASMQKAPSQPTNQQQRQAPPEALTLVTAGEKSEYGESIDVMRKVSREELLPVLRKVSEIEGALQQIAANLNTSVVPSMQRVMRQQTQTAEDRFWNILSERVPEWQRINNDPAFQAWLLEIDPLTGHTRQAFLEQAQQQLDPNRVVSIFKMYSPSGNGGQPASANAQTPTRSASELERQVSPSRSRAGAPPTNSQTSKTYTREDISKFFEDSKMGRFRGKEAERDRIERDIFAAQSEGRVVA